jgi:hypothetical protein
MKWIRIWPEYIINGTTFEELDLQERGLWFSLLVLAGHSPQPGKICIADGIPYTLDQIAALLRISRQTLDDGLKILGSPEINKIKLNGSGVIEITSWNRYQTEYDRQKPYRKALEKQSIKDSYKERLQAKVTGKSYTVDTDTDTDTEEEEDIKNKKKDVSVLKNPKPKTSYPADKEFLLSLKELYPYTDINQELNKMKAWLMTPKGRGRQLNRRFIVNWLGKIDKPISVAEVAPINEQDRKSWEIKKALEKINWRDKENEHPEPA